MNMPPGILLKLSPPNNGVHMVTIKKDNTSLSIIFGYTITRKLSFPKRVHFSSTGFLIYFTINLCSV